MDREKKVYGIYGEAGSWKGKIIWNVNKEYRKYPARKPLQNSASHQSGEVHPSWFRTPGIGQTEVHKHNPRPTPRWSEPDGRWPAPRPWAGRGAIGVPTQPGGFLPRPACTPPPFCLQDDRELWRADL